MSKLADFGGRARILAAAAAMVFVFLWAAIHERSALASDGAPGGAAEQRQSPAAPKELGGTQTMTFQITSIAFQSGARIPTQYTGDGPDVSPPLHWKDAPAAAKSFALICDDPDAPGGTWVHWVVWNIPADKTELAENVQKTKELADGTRQGTNDFRKIGYNGPAPPKGPEHRYLFKLYALDGPLTLAAGSGKSDLLESMQGHTLAEAQLIGRYKR